MTFFVSSISYWHNDLSLLKEFSKIFSFSNSYSLPSQSAVQTLSMSTAYVITQGICNNFIEVIFFVGCMVWRPNRLYQRSTTMSLINKISNIKKQKYNVLHIISGFL